NQTVVRTWTFVDSCGNTSSVSQTITVNDTTAPSIDTTNLEDITIECGVTPDGTLEAWLADNAGATVTDNCTATQDIVWTNDFRQLADVDCDSGAITVTFRATDLCGNFSEVTATYSIIDTVAPELTIPSDVTLECDEDSSTASTGVAAADDDCTTPIVEFSDEIIPGTCPNSFTIERTWTATDVCGNTSTATQTISVVDTTPPTITAPEDATVEC
ncbi:hypothetical protein J1C55_13855, partial [Winogradskyella sp. E313]|nr:hypothetical protein [Winogradskyella immobilis]MCG0017773.1 hypothetical protein [Winogradskyella immobilis]